MAEGREVSAWINASKMSGCNYMFVEGVSDECLWKKFINRESILIQKVNGWENVVACVQRFNEETLDSYCFGVIDSDFEQIYPHKSIAIKNLFMTDLHDIEMMMYKSEAWDSALKAIDKRNRITAKPQEVLDSVLEITDRIGLLKLSSLRHNLRLVFKKENRNHELELPKYENIIDRNGMYVGDKKLIQYIYSFSNSNKRSRDPIPSVSDLEDRFRYICTDRYPSEHLSNGHDITYVMNYVLRRKYGLTESYISTDSIEIALFAAYNIDLLKQTNLYNSICKWERVYNKSIFI